MKIAYIYPALDIYGGADRIITQKANYLADRFGYDVYVITAHQCGKPLSFPLLPSVTHIDMAVDFHKQYGKPLIKRASIYLRLIREYKKKLSILFHKEKFDIVITTISRDIDFINDIKDGSIKLAEAHISKAHVRNLHLLQHKNFIYRTLGKIWTRKLEKNISKFERLIVLTNKDAESWKHITDALVIPNFIPIKIEEISSRKSKNIISVGRLYPQKGYDFLIEAWSLIHHKYPDWTINIYGEGEQEEYLASLIEKNNIGRSFKIHKPLKNIQEKYVESSFYVMSSRFEGLPLVLIEAMASGLPAVSFDCPEGPKDIINDGTDGFLVENANVGHFAEKMSQLIENEDMRIKMGEAAVKAMERFTSDLVMQNWSNLFESLMKKKQSSA